MAADPFAHALESFISDVKSKEDIRSPFYKEVLARVDNGSIGKDLSTNSEVYADKLSIYIENLHLKQKRDSKTLWITEKLRPLISGLSQFTGACDSMFQAAPAAVQVLYGGAKLVLQLAQNFYNCFDTVLSIMEDIGHLLQCYHLFSSSYRSSVEIQNLLVEAYKNIVLFWQKASQLLNRKVYKTILVGIVKPLDAQWQQFRQRLQKDSTRVQMLAMATEADLRRQKDVERAKDRETDLKRQIIDWIKAGEDDCSLDTRRKIKENVERRHENTCDWFFDHPITKQWIDAKETTAIWYNAPPGAGKTVLASAIARTLQDRGLKTVTYFYSFNDNVCKQTITALRCLALQLMVHNNHIPDKVQRLYEEDLTNHCFKLTDIQVAVEVVESLIKQVNRVHIIIDGLDECENESQHFDRFSNLLRAKTLGKVKWLFTSRQTSSIRTHLRDHDVKEIQAPQDSLLKDIKQYVSDQLSCTTCVEHWTTESEGNFQWISYMLRIMDMDRNDLTCEEEIDEELKKFPKGLNGCYLRSLAQLSEQPEKHQNLAQKIFTMIVGASQPLTLSEISHAVAVTPSSHDFYSRRVPRPELIQKLCSNLVLFDQSSDDTDPILKFAHKSIHDFFLQDPDSSAIPTNLRKYFVSDETAALELGQSCLHYLNYSRYHLPQDVLKIIQDEEHAFLKHAATFWYSYLDRANHSEDLFRKVEDFVQSLAFWTCVEVQCRTSPYLFARYFRVNSGYNIDCTSSRQSKTKDNFAYAVPLPQWLEDYAPTGKQIVHAFYTFIRDWHLILISEPSAIDQCIIDPLWEKTLPGKFDRHSELVKLVSLCKERTLLSNFSSLSVTSLKTDSENILVKLFGNQILNDGCIPEWISLQVLSDKLSTLGRVHANNHLPLEVCRNKYGFNVSDVSNKFSLVDPSSLLVEGYAINDNGGLELISETFDTPQIKEKRSGSWNLLHKSSYNTFDRCSSYQKALAFHFSHDTTFQDDNSSELDSGIGMTNTDDSDSNVSEDSDDDTDASSHDPATSNRLLILCNGREPTWYLWKSTSLAVEVCCAFHPDQNFALWSPSAHELCVLDLESRNVSSTILPEPPDVQFATLTAMRKEFCFLESGQSLSYLLYTAKQQDENTIHQTVSISYFDLSFDDNKNICLRRSHPVQTLSYDSFGSVTTPLERSMILTSWSPENLLIGLPPLSCNPKVVRIQHPRNAYSSSTSPIATSTPCSPPSSNNYSDSHFQTLRTPIFFPFTTLDRNPRLTVLDYPKNETSLVLCLDAEILPSLPKATIGFTMRQPPALMMWRLSHKDGEDWRDWDSTIDEQSEKLKQENWTYNKLRGSFVATDRRFTVPVRSGLDWTKKAFLSCA
jgi:hypothetical protein